ncbi:MAG TPA: hypothetical protein VFS59_02135, partial [Gemmatimonadaceae bacterium]|nr:hypothetical protein [Gemmatimonadaceae bacterium]
MDWANRTLDTQAKTLLKLRDEIADPAFGEWMQGVSRGIISRTRECEASAREGYRRTMVASGMSSSAAAYGPDLAGSGTSWRCLVDATEAVLKWERTVIDADQRAARQGTYDYVSPSAPRERYLELLAILRSQKQFTDVVEAFAESPMAGIDYSRSLVDGAAKAVEEFSQSLRNNPTDIWRYRVAVLGAVRDMRLDDVVGVQDFALALAALRSEGPMSKLISYLGIGLLIAGFVTTGPATGLAVLNVALSGGTTYLT